MAVASCLITTDPQFEPPAKTAPFFLPDTATPSADGVIRIIKGDIKTFSALFQAEDAGVDVHGRLYLDYGSQAPPKRVYVSSIELDEEVPTGSWADGPRLVTATYNENEFSMSVGCHLFTLMVVHDGFVASGCPVEDGDYDTQTWLVQYCGDVPDEKDCPAFDVGSCPIIADDLSTKCPPSKALPANAGGSQ